MKKIVYNAPEMEVIEIKVQSSLLQMSTGEPGVQDGGEPEPGFGPV